MAQIIIISLYDEFCLGPRYITSYLQQAGHKADLVLFKHCHAAYQVPAEKQDPDDYLEHFYASKKEISLLQNFIKEKDPLWVGFSFMSVSSGLAIELTRRVREVTHAPIVWGGVDTTVNPDWAIEHADMICLGEGEGAAMEITEALENGGDLSAIQNMWVRQNGTITKNDIRPLIQDLDNLPTPNFKESSFWHIDQDEMNQGKLPDCSPLNPWHIIMASRGCPYRCAYCVHSVTHDMAKGKGKYLRRRSVRNVIDELAAHKKKKPDTSQIMFYDDVFTFDRKWIAEFADAYKREIDIPFWVYTYPELCDPEILGKLRDIGLIYVHMGIQSGSESFLKEVYERRLTNKKVLEASKTLKDLGIYAIYDMLVGIPLETEEELRESLNLLLQLPEPFGLNVWPTLFYHNYKVTKRLWNSEEAKSVIRVNGTHVDMYPAESPYLRYWLVMLRLTRYPQIPREQYQTLLENESLRNDPAPLEIMEEGLFKAAFVHNTEFMHKDCLIEQLYEERSMLQHENKCLRNRKILKLQSRIEKVLGWPQHTVIQSSN